MSRTRLALLVFVVLATVVIAVLLRHGELVQTLATIPLFATLTAVAVEVLREQARRQHESTQVEAERRFLLGASSHMAATAFDKHVAFCEEYVAEVHAALQTLFREGPTREALEHSDRLFRIKQRHVVWITDDLELRLSPFEKALRRIGANDLVGRQFPASDGHAARTKEMFRYFAEVLGTAHMGEEWEGEAISDDAAVARVVRHLREVLGVEALTRLRTLIVEKALRTETN